MLHIVCPVDFSEVSQNALQYAYQLMSSMNEVQVTFYHSVFLNDIDKVKRGLIEDGEDNLNQWISALELPAHIRYEKVVNKSQLIDGIKKIHESHPIDLLIMGVSGKDTISQKVFGSNTLAVVHHTSIPVLAVPSDAVFTPVQQVLMAIPYKKDFSSKMPLTKIETIFNAFNVKILLATVCHDAAHHEKASILQEQELLLSRLDSLSPQLYELEGGHIAQSLVDFSELGQTQWIVTVSEEHNLWYKLMTGSVTNALIYQVHQPILIFSAHK